MYLKKLEIQGFKSFPHKTALEFDKGISSIVGPNGCGKSNISDAIRWVLGEQSMKAIRGNKLEDIIFVGTQFKKQVGFAEVTLTIDNTDSALPLDYSEVSITRRFFRSGESEFFINKSSCRLKDIYNLFLDTGIGRDGYSIIGQGRIDEILSSKSEDRRKVFEEASGIMKYRVRKEESEKKLEAAGQNLLRINDIMTELENMLSPLEEQSKKAKEYLSMKEDLKILEINYYLDQIYKAGERVREAVKLYDAAIEEKKEIDERLGLLSKKRKYNERRISEIELKNETTKRDFYEIEKTLEKLKAEAEYNERKIDDIDKRIKDLEYTIINGNSTLEALNDDLCGAQERLNRASEEIREAQDAYESLKNETDSLSGQIEVFRVDLDKSENILNEKNGRLSDYRILAGNYDARYNSAVNQISKLDKEIEDIYIKTSDEEKNLTSFRQLVDQNKIRLESMMSELEKSIIFKRNKENEADKFKENRDKLVNKLHSRKSEYSITKTMEENLEGYNRTTKAFLKHISNSNLLKGMVKGALGQLISVDEEHRTAVEIALGPAIHNIVTLTEDDAKKAIEILKKYSMGRATFLPISSIKSGNLSINMLNNLKKEPGFVAVASELVKYDNLYSGIVNNLLGRVVVADSLESGINIARKYNYSFRIVTLKGEMLSTQGAITGGSIDFKSQGILGRSDKISALADEIKSIEKEVSKIDLKLNEIKSIVSDLDDRINKIRNDIRFEENTKMKNDNNIHNCIRIIGELSQRQDLLKHDRSALMEQVHELEDEKKILENKIKSTLNEIDEIKNKIDEFMRVHKDKLIKKDSLYHELTEKRIAINSLKGSKSAIEKEIVGINDDFVKCKADLLVRNKELESLNTEILSIHAANEGLMKNIKSVSESRQGRNLLIDSMTEEITELKNEIMDLSEESESLNEKTKLLNDELNRLSVRKTRAESDSENSSNRLWDDYELTYVNAGIYKRNDFMVSRAQKEISEIKDNINRLGPVNVNAIDEFTRTRERHDFLQKQKADLEQAESKLRIVIKEINETMQKQFLQKFATINENFNHVFHSLFQGGSARLKLSDQSDILNCNIEIEVQMPGKKMQNMMLLSGGERAFTAIALLFATLMLNPVSFCVLDEIEAALDDTNVARFAEFLKKMSASTQFIVITHRKGTMEAADSIYGVTMEEKGISKVVSMKMTG